MLIHNSNGNDLSLFYSSAPEYSLAVGIIEVSIDEYMYTECLLDRLAV